jgi:hypothetical protein
MHLKFVWRIVELAYTGRSPEELARGFEPTATSIRNRLRNPGTVRATTRWPDDSGTQRAQPAAA